jgi:hypothetical protein
MTELREVLDSLNGEVAHYHDGCARLQRQSSLVDKEKKSYVRLFSIVVELTKCMCRLEEHFRSREAEYNKATQALENSRQMLEMRLSQSRDHLNGLTSSVDVLKMLDERVVSKDKRIRDLEIELGVAKNQARLLEGKSNASEPPPNTVPGKLEADAQASPQDQSSISAEILELNTMKDKLSQALTNAVTLERQNTDLAARLKLSEQRLVITEQE